MKRLLLPLLLLLPQTTSASGFKPLWGVNVYSHPEGEFVTSHWPEGTRFSIGSGSQADLKLDGLDEIHADFELTEAGIVANPIGYAHLLINDDPAEDEGTLFDTTATVVTRDYRFGFFTRASLPGNGGSTTEESAETPVTPEVVPGELADKALEARKEEFAKDGYGFCQNDEFGEDPVVGADFCSIFDEDSNEVCPETRKTCPWEEHQGTSVAGGVGDGKEGRRRYLVRRRSSRPIISIPPMVGYVILGILIAALLAWFVVMMKKAGWDSDEFEYVEDISEAARNFQALPEARSHVLLKLANRALARGEEHEAATMAHLAVLRYLDDEGLARYHPSKTNGDYVRAIRKNKELAQLFRGIANQTERIRFGDGEVDGKAIAELLIKAQELLVTGSMLPPAAPQAAGAVLFLFAVSGALSACGSACDTLGDPAYYARSPTGMKALPALLREAGIETELSHRHLNRVAPDVGAVVLRTSAGDPRKWPKELRLDTLLDRKLSVVVLDDLGASSFFLPTTSTMADKIEKKRWVDRFQKRPTYRSVRLQQPGPDVKALCTWKLQSIPSAVEGDAVMLPRGRRLVWDGSNTNTSTVTRFQLRLHPILVYEGEEQLSSGETAAVAFSAERRMEGGSAPGCMYVFSDRDLFTNASLTRTENTRWVVSFFAAILDGEKKVLFLDRLDSTSVTGSGDADEATEKEDKPSPAKALKASNLLPFLLQSFATLVILFLFVGASFGRLRDPVKREHKAFVGHVEAIGRQYAKTGVMGLNHAAQSLAKLVVMRYRERVRGGAGGGWSGLAEDLARKRGLQEEDVKAALRLGIEGVSELGAPRIEDPAPASDRMLRTLSALLSGKEEKLKLKQKRSRFKRSSGQG